MAKRFLTRDDVIRSGACAGGVLDWADKHAAGLTVIATAAALRCAKGLDKGYIRVAAEMHGYGDSYGDGDGDGDGYGYGYGYGNGNGNGYGNGNSR